MTDKIYNGIEAISKVATLIHENTDIQPKDRRKVMAAILEPMLNEIFGSEYEKYKEDK
jgi:hypothetical protein